MKHPFSPWAASLLAVCVAWPAPLFAQVPDAPAPAAPAPAAPAPAAGPGPAAGPQNNFLGKDAPFLDPGSEIMTWDGKAWNVNNNRLFSARFEKYLNSEAENSAADASVPRGRQNDHRQAHTLPDFPRLAGPGFPTAAQGGQLPGGREPQRGPGLQRLQRLAGAARGPTDGRRQRCAGSGTQAHAVERGDDRAFQQPGLHQLEGQQGRTGPVSGRRKT